MSYFKNIQSLNDLKEQFKKLAREHHPDTGGNVEVMKQINREYDNLFPIWRHRYNASSEHPTEETSDSTRNEFYTENGWEGEKHDWSRDIKDVAALIRNYIKEVYPTYKFSVRIDRYSMGQTLYTELKEAPQDIYKTRDELTNEDLNVIYRKLKVNSYYNGDELGGEEFEQALQKAWSESNFYKVYNEVTQIMIKDVEREVKSYNYQDIDSMIDYFHVDFHYFGVKVSSDLKIVKKQARVKSKENTENSEHKRYNIEKSQHTKTGEDIWLVKISDKLGRNEFLQEKQKMKEMGGYYSKYTHSFVFKEDPSENLTDKEKTNRETLLVQNEKSENQLELETEGKKIETFEDWKKFTVFTQAGLVHNLEVELSIPDKECITSYWGDLGEYEFKYGLSEQERFARYSKLRKLNHLSQKIQGVELGNFEWDEDNYLHFTAQVDGYELEGLFRTSDSQNGEDMNLVSIDYGYNHPQIKEQWNNIEEFLKEYSLEKYNEIAHGKTTIVEENYKDISLEEAEETEINELIIESILDEENDFKLEQVSVKLNSETPLYSDESIRCAEDAVRIVGKELMAQFDREQICIINLNTQNNPINFSIASVGTLNNALIEPREMLKASILSNAGKVILLHNHVGGSLRASEEDYKMTKKIITAFESVGIKVLDHVIIGGNNKENFYSMREDNSKMFENYKVDGKELKLTDIGEKLMKTVSVFLVAEDLAYWVNNTYSTISLENDEAELILNYMDGHGYNLGVDDENLVRIDLESGDDEMINYNIESAIYDICDWNSDLQEETTEKLEKAYSVEEVYKLRQYMNGLRSDEELLDKMFAKTTLGKTLDLGIESQKNQEQNQEEAKRQPKKEKGKVR